MDMAFNSTATDREMPNRLGQHGMSPGLTTHAQAADTACASCDAGKRQVSHSTPIAGVCIMRIAPTVSAVRFPALTLTPRAAASWQIAR